MIWPIFDNNDHHQAITNIINSESDVIAAVVGGAMLDEAITETLRLRFRNDDRDSTKKLLKPSGAMGNSGAKIDVLYQLQFIDKTTHRTLAGMTKIRNAFAHNLAITFDSDEKDIVDGIKMLRLHEGLTHYPHTFLKRRSMSPIEPIVTNRDKFTVNLKLGLNALMHVRVDHRPHTLEKRSPEDRAEVEREWKERKLREGLKQNWFDNEPGGT